MLLHVPQPKGWLAVTLLRQGSAGRILAGPNAIAAGMFTCLASLLAGSAAGIVQGAVGTGTAAPNASDTGLTQAILLPASARAQGAICHFSFELPPALGNGLAISEYGLFYGDVLIARTVRSPIPKADDIALACEWQIDFSGGV